MQVGKSYRSFGNPPASSLCIMLSMQILNCLNCVGVLMLNKKISISGFHGSSPITKAGTHFDGIGRKYVWNVVGIVGYCIPRFPNPRGPDCSTHSGNPTTGSRCNLLVGQAHTSESYQVLALTLWIPGQTLTTATSTASFVENPSVLSI